MTTHGIIGMFDGERLQSVYLHHDAYPLHTGRMLLDCYADTEAVRELLAMGDMSSIERTIGYPRRGDWSAKAKGQCKFYIRDLDESEETAAAELIPDIKDWNQAKDIFIRHYRKIGDWSYLFNSLNQNWHIVGAYENMQLLATHPHIVNTMEEST